MSTPTTALDTRTRTVAAALGQRASASSVSVVLASDQSVFNDYPTYGTPTLLSVSGTSATTASLAAGKYLLVSTIDVCWIQGASPTAQWLAGSSEFLPAGALTPVTLTAQALAAITAGGSGMLFIIPVS